MCACRGSDPAVLQWTDVLDRFCTDEFGVKTRQYHCCRQQGAARRRCFAQGPDAIATTAVVTVRDPIAEPPFPPGEPTAANMGNICGLRGLRPGPPGPSGPSGPRVRLRLRLEREYSRCCRNGSLACAHDAVSARAGVDTGGQGGTQGFGKRTQVFGRDPGVQGITHVSRGDPGIWGRRPRWLQAGGPKHLGRGPSHPGKGPRCLGGTQACGVSPRCLGQGGGNPGVQEGPRHPGKGPRCPGAPTDATPPCPHSGGRGWSGSAGRRQR